MAQNRLLPFFFSSSGGRLPKTQLFRAAFILGSLIFANVALADWNSQQDRYYRDRMNQRRAQSVQEDSGSDWRQARADSETGRASYYSRSSAYAGHGARESERDQNLAGVDVRANIPFVHYTATVTVHTDSNGSLEAISIRGNIPGMQSMSTSIGEFAREGFEVNGRMGPALSLNFEGPFQASSGGSIVIHARMCQGGFQSQQISVGQSGGRWGMQVGGRSVYTIYLVAQASVTNGWSGCFNQMGL